MNEKSEQIDAGLNYHVDYDEPLDWRGSIFAAVGKALPQSQFEVRRCKLSDGMHRVGYYVASNGIRHFLLLSAVTFLGGAGCHPIFKKRIQMKRWYKGFYNSLNETPDACVHFMGVYHYRGNILFVDFDAQSYVGNKMHNSSAFVYTNDLYRAMKDGIAFRRDFNGHGITTIARTRLLEFLENGGHSCDNDYNSLIEVFMNFNSTFPFRQWIAGISAIKEMCEGGDRNWRQTEWAGWFLEYKFYSYLDSEHITTIEFCRNKKHDENLDFDLWFPIQKFYGDLKASDVSEPAAPGNAQTSMLAAINKYDRLWYVVFEHATIKDSAVEDKFCDARKTFLLCKDGAIKNREHKSSRHRVLKNQVCFNRMFIFELNRMNYQSLLTSFNQGRQSTGHSRKPKFNLQKKRLSELENYQILHYEPDDDRSH